MFGDIVIAGLFNQFHREADDRLLDQTARDAGCPSGIGRLSLVSDEMLGAILGALHISDESRLLDMGCGRGFFERWLRWRGSAVRAVGIDRAPDAIAAARKHAAAADFITADYRTHRFDEPFDAVLALEAAASGAIDAATVAAVRAALRDGGRFALTAASLDGKHEARLNGARGHLARSFPQFEIADATQTVAGFAERLYRAWLGTAGWSAAIQPRIEAQAREVLGAIERGDFHYVIVTGRV